MSENAIGNKDYIIEAFDNKNGKPECDNNGNPINYGDLKILTPFTCTRLKFNDKNGNEIFVIFAELKSVERAIEKLEKEFSKEHFKNVQNAIEQYYTDEDPDKRVERLQEVPETTSLLHDILRLTITCNYLSNVKQMMEDLSRHKKIDTKKSMHHNGMIFEDKKKQSET